MQVVKMEKILIVGPAWVGDMVMAQSLFKVLKEQHPEVPIDVIAPAWSRGLLERMPEVNASWVLPFQHGEFKPIERYKLGKSLRSQGYTQVILLPNSFKSVLVPLWAKIPLRTGWRGEWPRSLLLNDARRLDKAQLPLMIQRFIALGLAEGASLPTDLPRPALNISPLTRNAALEKHQLSLPKRLLVLAPGAEFGPSKRWPAQYYADVANAKIKQGWGVWLFGSPKDSPIAQEICAATNGQAIDLTGKTSLAEAIDLMSLATVVVTNDSGLMHIAAAVGRPIVAVYGSTSPAFTPPLADQVEILSLNLSCSPCFERVCPLGHWRCMRDLQPQQVLRSIDILIG
jgi:heptosyltransferase-2